MKFTTDIDKGTALRRHKVIGKLSKNKLLESLGKLYTAPDFQPDMDVLWDLREADLSVFSTVDIELVRDFVGARWGTGGSSRAALVVSRDVDFGLSRMFEMLLESHTTSKVQVFRDMDEALEWLGS